MNPICFYHSADLDGICSGAIVRHFVRGVELVGYDYGQDFPWEKIQGRDVIMVDVSLPVEGMKRLKEESARFAWIDHHKSAIEAVIDADCVPLYRNCRVADPGGRPVSACELTWEWFATDGGMAQLEEMMPMPLTVHLLGRYDVWDHEGEPRAMPFQYGARVAIQGVDDPIWHHLLNPDVKETHAMEILESGRAILSYQQSEDAKVARTCCFDARLDEFKILACNRSHCNSSLFDSVWDQKKYHMMSVFYLNKDRQWRVSLYTTRTDVDCSEVAKRYGGGGHMKAAGFVCDEMPYGKTS